jgi:carbon starvation protein
LLFEALFILTTIDAGTRVARYLIQEMGGVMSSRFANLNWMPGAVLSSGLVVAAWGYLIANGTIATIWPMFGAANQLLGTLALCVGTTLLIKMGKPRFVWITLGPMLFVGTITLTASWQLFGVFSAKAAAATTARDVVNFRLDAALVALVATLAVVILIDSARLWYGYLVQKRPYRSTEVASPEVYSLPTDPGC